MSTHPSPGWRRTVGPQWSSVKRQGTGSVPPPAMQQGFHISNLHALSRPDLDSDFLQQQQERQQQQQEQQEHQQSVSFASSSNQLATGSNQLNQQLNGFSTLSTQDHTQSEHQRTLQQQDENQRQQQLYLQQVQLTQRLQGMPTSTTRPWYPTFGPAITTSCSDSTIQLDSPQQYTLNNNAKLNRHAVGPHWRSIQTSSTFSPTPSPPSSSPLLHARALAPSSTLGGSNSFSSLSSASTTTSLHAFFASTYSTAASIDHVRATSFHHQNDQEMSSADSSRQQFLQQQPVHQQYYQSHSYPHDPRHHLNAHGSQPGNSIEARDSTPITNRGSPMTPDTARFPQYQPAKKTKRKAAWQDQEDSRNEDGDDDEDVSANSGSTHDCQQSGPASALAPWSASSQAPMMPSSIQQFVPDPATSAPSALTDRADEDQEMGNAETSVSTNATSSTSSRMSMDTGSMEREAMQVAAALAAVSGEEHNANNDLLKPAKRTKPRLDTFGNLSAAEARRAQSGDRVQDIFQECFYNAASSR
ncbi:hypothetical protein BGZ68_004639 [Mortierella alpina]|nr:hypothetical protein BGZ68_004639 [Mortierella alpina]